MVSHHYSSCPLTAFFDIIGDFDAFSIVVYQTRESIFIDNRLIVPQAILMDHPQLPVLSLHTSQSRGIWLMGVEHSLGSLRTDQSMNITMNFDS